MSPILFYLFAAMTLVFAVAVVANRNPVASALSLVVSFLGLAAVMVLFLFIIMLLNIQAEERRKINVPAYAAGGLVTVAFIAQLWFVLQKFELGKTAFAPLAEKHVDDVRNVGNTLFSTHNLPFQVIGVLILVATIGGVVLSKRELK